MSDIKPMNLPGLPLLLQQQSFDAGTGESGLLNGLVSNIDRKLVRYTFGAQAKGPRRGDMSAIAGVLNGSDGAR